ncbi:hypothetical protein BNJ_00304 [Kaumoebavirus]|uniref:hypothetical protein n=1 Tax=Kaumoebavirus TaxID=1859492 RepID=UPI0009C31C15|nr:hypothetical protein BNJ_00304 [Kaumoebavirus]ARA72126.1 hypothetical protein BNJ_00304 [Kaumoebavirus]
MESLNIVLYIIIWAAFEWMRAKGIRIPRWATVVFLVLLTAVMLYRLSMVYGGFDKINW